MQETCTLGLMRRGLHRAAIKEEHCDRCSVTMNDSHQNLLVIISTFEPEMLGFVGVGSNELACR